PTGQPQDIAEERTSVLAVQGAQQTLIRGGTHTSDTYAPPGRFTSDGSFLDLLQVVQLDVLGGRADPDPVGRRPDAADLRAERQRGDLHHPGELPLQRGQRDLRPAIGLDRDGADGDAAPGRLQLDDAGALQPEPED